MEYTHALSLMIDCDDQAQVDSVWNAFLAHGGKEEQCGWLRIAGAWPGRWCRRRCSNSCRARTRPAAARAVQAMMKMVKLDVDVLRQAFEGKSAA